MNTNIAVTSSWIPNMLYTLTTNALRAAWYSVSESKIYGWI